MAVAVIVVAANFKNWICAAANASSLVVVVAAGQVDEIGIGMLHKTFAHTEAKAI